MMQGYTQRPARKFNVVAPGGTSVTLYLHGVVDTSRGGERNYFEVLASSPQPENTLISAGDERFIGAYAHDKTFGVYYASDVPGAFKFRG